MIYRVALNTCITLYRKTDKISYVDSIVDVPEIVEHSPNFIVLNELINRLDRIERALTLLYLEDRTYEEIAEITGLRVTNITTNNITTKLSRTR